MNLLIITFAPHLTCSCDQRSGSAAAEAVQQRLGPDVVVEESRRAADLHQGQPQPQVGGLVSEEQRHRVALSDAAALQEDPGGLVAELVGVPVRERLIFEAKEGLVRLRLHHLQEPVQDGVVDPGVLLDAAPDF